MPKQGNGGQPAGPDHHPVAPLGHPSGEPLQLAGHGVTVRYTPSHLKVTWDSGTEVTMRPAGRRIVAYVSHLTVADTVTLTLEAGIAVPEPWFSKVTVVLAFPRSLAPGVEQLAERLNAAPDAAPRMTSPPDAPPSPGAPHGHVARPVPPELPAVTFGADLAVWADDNDWIGLYPARETARLVTARLPRHSREDSLPSPS